MIEHDGIVTHRDILNTVVKIDTKLDMHITQNNDEHKELSNKLQTMDGEVDKLNIAKFAVKWVSVGVIAILSIFFMFLEFFQPLILAWMKN